MRDLSLVNGKWLDANNANKEFSGVVPRDLEIGDKFAQNNNGVSSKVTLKDRYYESENGLLIIEVG